MFKVRLFLSYESITKDLLRVSGKRNYKRFYENNLPYASIRLSVGGVAKYIRPTGRSLFIYGDLN